MYFLNDHLATPIRNSKRRTPYLKANMCISSQKMPRIIWKQRFLPMFKRRSTGSYPESLYSVFIPTFCFFKIHFNRMKVSSFRPFQTLVFFACYTSVSYPPLSPYRYVVIRTESLFFVQYTSNTDPGGCAV
jgi:hypothetical protein